MLKPLGLTHGHYECRKLDETLPVLTDLLAMRVVERKGNEALVEHPNTAWRLIVHEVPNSPEKPHNNHYGVRVAHEEEIDAAHAYLEANKARYGLKRVSPPRSQHFARSVYFEEPGGNTLEIEYYAPQAAGSVRWDDPTIGIEWPDIGMAPQLSPKDQQAPLLSAAASFE